MKISAKKVVYSGILSGLVYAVLMAGYHYSDGQEFSPLRFLMSFVLFGGIMGLYNWYKLNKQTKKNEP